MGPTSVKDRGRAQPFKVIQMITTKDGKYCPHCRGYVNPWIIRSAIAKGAETYECRGCGFKSYIEDLKDADVVE